MPEPFTAADARKAVADFLLAKVYVSNLIDHIHEKIKRAASSGKTSIEKPLDDRPSGERTMLHIKAVTTLLRNEGYYAEIFCHGDLVDGKMEIQATLHSVSWEDPK